MAVMFIILILKTELYGRLNFVTRLDSVLFFCVKKSLMQEFINFDRDKDQRSENLLERNTMKTLQY